MQDTEEVNLEDDDYDDETDEFAGYSGSKAHQYSQSNKMEHQASQSSYHTAKQSVSGGNVKNLADSHLSRKSNKTQE